MSTATKRVVILPAEEAESVRGPVIDEAALLPSGERGWHTAEPGQQIISLLFHKPQRLRRIRLRFAEPPADRGAWRRGHGRWRTPSPPRQCQRGTNWA